MNRLILMMISFLAIISITTAFFIMYTNVPNTSEIIIDADWVNLYPNFKELADSSDLIIRGVVLNSISYKLELSEPVSTPLLLTNYTIKIEEIIKGYEDSETINVRMTGGRLDGKVISIRGCPPMKEGETVILFLKRFTKDNYYIIGGPQGRFIIKGGKVYSLGEIYPSAKKYTSHLKTNGIPIREFIESIEQ